jgi:hypothetical protein
VVVFSRPVSSPMRQQKHFCAHQMALFQQVHPF